MNKSVKYNKVGNIIEFPVEHKSLISAPLINVIDNANLISDTDIQIVTEELCLKLFESMYKFGFRRYEDGENQKALAMISESIRSILCKQRNIRHPFQGLSEKLFSLDEKDNMLYYSTTFNDL